jgi:WD40 repeat protein/serine/threonine protein kinase
MSDSPPRDDEALAELLGQLADEFTERLHRGERPDVEEFAARHPHVADVVRQVLPALQAMRLPAADTSNGPAAPPAVLGDFQIIREIGRGGMGVVYEAAQLSIARRVALKVLPLGPAIATAHLARFQREARTAAQLHHTNIVPVFAVGCAQGVHFYAMQYIDGESLDRLLEKMRRAIADGRSLGEVQQEQARRTFAFRGPQAPSHPQPLSPNGAKGAKEATGRGPIPDTYFHMIARLGIQVAEALDYAHQRRVVHRDIKPSNLILDRQGIVWISDFGLVKSLEEADSNLTKTGDLLGTARYMSPEQAVGKRSAVDQRSDLYSLGATLYELLTLRAAFATPDPAIVLQQIAFDEPPAPRQLNRAIPRDLETIVLKAMAKRPADRYPSAADLAADLRRFLAGEPIRARPLSGGERLVRWAWRRPALAALVAVSVLATLALIGLMSWSNAELREANRRERQRAREAEEAKEQERLRAQEAEERERIGRRHLYAAQMNLVHHAWERGHVGRVRAVLDNLRPPSGQEDLRGFEWFYYRRLAHRDRFTLHGHAHVVSAVAVDLQGSLLATGSHDGTVKIWDIATGELRDTLAAAGGRVSALAWEGRSRIVAATQDGMLTFWDRIPGTSWKRSAITIPNGATSLAIQPGGSSPCLAVGCIDGTIRLHSEHRERVVLVGHTEAVLAVAVSPDGMTLASGSADQTVRLWDLMTFQTRDVLAGHIGQVRTVAFSPDGTVVASAAGETVSLWDSAIGKPLGQLKGHTDSVGGVAFSPDGKTLASVSGDPDNPLKPGDFRFKPRTVRAKPGEVKLWNVATHMERATLKGHTGPVYCVGFMPDGNRLVTGSDDMTAIVWDIAGSEQATLPGHRLEINALAFAPDGKTLASVSDDTTIKLWDIASGQRRATLRHPGNVKFVVYSPDGTLLATGGGDRFVKVWDALTGLERTTLRGHRYTIRAIAFSPDGTLLASCAGDPGARAGEIKVWDLARRQVRFELRGHNEAVRSIAISPDGKLLASASDDRTVKLWDLHQGHELATLLGHDDWVRYVAFAPDGKTLASASNDGTVKLWDVASRRERLTLRGHRAGVLIVVYSPDRQTIATGSTDGTVKLWDAVTGQERAVLEGHKGGIRAVAFAQDGKILATGDNEPRIKLWYAARD